MQELQLGVLGPLEVRRDGVAVPVPRGRRRAVLAALVQDVGRPVRADALVEAGWGRDLPDDPAGALHTVLSRLRSVLGEAAITATAGGYLLDVPADAVDARRFERLLGRARAAPAAEAARLLDEALALWRGRAYDELADGSAAAAEAARLEELRLDAVEEHASVALELGRTEVAVAALEDLCRRQPFRERARALLMTGLYRAGRATEALDRYRAYRRLLDEELGLRPSPSLRRLEAQIIGHDLEVPDRADAAGRTPAWLDLSTSFVGREQDLAALVEAVPAARLVTVTGPGGVGKTRLVAEAVPDLRTRTASEVVVVELAAVEPGGVAAAVAGAHGLQPAGQDVAADLVDFCSTRAELLVLDNCEHLAGEVAGLVELLLRRGPGLRVLATSRRRLGPVAERVLPLEPLTGPDAVGLFTDRVHRLRPDFAADEPASGSAEEICRGVDGLPLAVELAAASAATLGLSAVRSRLAEAASPLDLAGPTAERDVLRSVVAWSYQLLDDDQRALLQLLSVLPVDPDPATVEELVAAAGDWLRGDPRPALSALVEASLLQVQGIGDVASYRMLAIVRAFAAEELRRSGSAEQAHRAHAEWVRSVTEHAREAATGPGGAAAYLRLDRLRPSIRAALRWAVDAGEADLAGDVTGALRLCPHWSPGSDLTELVIAVAEQELARDAPRSLPVGAGAVTLADLGDLDRSRELARSAAGMAGTPHDAFLAHLAGALVDLYSGDLSGCDDHARQITALPLPLALRADAEVSLTLTACYRGDPEAAVQADLALAAAAASGATAVEAFAQYAAGEVAARDDPARARELFAAAVDLADAAGVAHVSMVARIGLLSVQVRAGSADLLDVGRLLEDEQRAGAWPQTWTTLRILAELLADRGRPHDACFVLAAALAAPTAPPLTGDDVQRYADLRDRLLAALGEDVVGRIGELARSAPRTQVLDRAKALADELG